jgi:uncharacterized protein (TIGR02246 family)
VKTTTKIALVALAATSIASEARGQALPGAMIDIGGHSVHLVCSGEGEPTILLDAGAGGWSFNWLATQTELASAGFRVCAWDRPGVGLSDVGHLPRTSATIVREMRALIEAAQLSTPIVLVGHSFGGQNVRMFAATYPDAVAGVVLVDSGHEQQWARFDPTIWQAVEGQSGMMRSIASAIRNGAAPPPSGVVTDHLSRKWSEAVERVYRGAQYYEGVANEFAGIPESNSQLANSGNLGSTPLLVLTAGHSFYAFEGTLDTDIAAANDIWLDLQTDLLNLSTRSRQVVEPDIDHRLLSTHPQLVADHIAEFARSLPGPRHPRNPEADAMEALLQRMTQAYANRDADAFSSVFAADIVVTDVNRRQVIEGRDQWRALSSRVMEAHRWMTLEAVLVAISGNRASVKLRWSGLLRGEALGREDDVEYGYDGVSLMTLEGNEIARHELYIDYASFRDQIGDPDAVRRIATIETAWRDYVEAWRGHELERIVSFFDANVQLLPANGEAMTSRAEFATWLKDNYRESTSVSLESLGLSVYETEAVRRGRYRVSADGIEVGSGYFMQVWHLAPDGHWRIKRGIFNSNGTS